jgi:hypothetical protein
MVRSINLLVVLTSLALVTAACTGEEAAAPGAATPTAAAPATLSSPAPQKTVATAPPEPNAKKQAALNQQLIAAAWKNDLRRARALIDQGADVNAKDSTVQAPTSFPPARAI